MKFCDGLTFGIECGPGWRTIIEQCCEEIGRRQQHTGRDDFAFTQIKEKFGSLRLYHYGGDEYIEGVIAMAEAMSSKTCESCGKPGETNSGGWLSTLCDDCRRGR